MDNPNDTTAASLELDQILGAFTELEDPRTSNATRHIFSELLFISLSAIICGAEGFTAMARFAQAKKGWLEQLLELPNGLPSHDAFGDLYAILDPEAFNECFMQWVAPFRQAIKEEVVAIDGKAMRRSHDNSRGLKMVHTVSAWADQNKLVLGQLCVEDKSNEITAIPKLLELLWLEGSIVTIDAMGTQKKIAAKIVEKKADYILALKENHETFYQEVQTLFADQETLEDFSRQGKRLEESTSSDKGHGRLETRRCVAIEAVDWYREHWQWEGLRTLVMIESTRQVGDAPPTVQRRYYLSSLAARSQLISKAIRSHWGVESMHWILDMTFREDESRARLGHAAKTLSMARKFALNLLRKAPGKDSIKGKQQIAGWNQEYLLKILQP
jgi:predicted transposase YbfD/YdcC